MLDANVWNFSELNALVHVMSSENVIVCKQLPCCPFRNFESTGSSWFVVLILNCSCIQIANIMSFTVALFTIHEHSWLKIFLAPPLVVQFFVLCSNPSFILPPPSVVHCIHLLFPFNYQAYAIDWQRWLYACVCSINYTTFPACGLKQYTIFI